MMAAPVADADWRGRATRLARRLADDGVITDPTLANVMAMVPRHAFAPAWWALDEYNAIDHLVDAEDPTQRDIWLDGAYDDRPLVTRWEPGTFGGEPVRIATSSVSQPSVVATLLDRLQPRPGMRVLEIGTGSGYNAALLSERVGDHNVTSVDIDPELVDAARTRLAGLDMHPHLDARDGLDPPGGPGTFDRIVATCAVSRIPPSWTALLADRGRIVAPTTVGGALVVLDRIDSCTLRGPIDPVEVRFMSMRAAGARDAAPTPPTADPRLAHVGTTDLDPVHLDDRDFALWLAMHDPNLRLTMAVPGAESTSHMVYNATARATVSPGGSGCRQVVQQGGRPWDTVEAAWRSFERAGRPRRSDVLLTVDIDRDAQYFHLARSDEERFPLVASGPSLAGKQDP